jgi:hypothetical protein
MTKNEIYNNYLIEEYKIVNIRIDEFVSRQTKIMNLYLVIIGGFLTFLIKIDEDSFILPLLPYILMLIMPTFLYHYHRTIILQGYRRHLEKNINIQFKIKPILYSITAKKFLLRNNIFSILNYIVMGLGSSLIIIFSNINNLKGWGVFQFVVQLIIFIAIFTIFAIKTNNGAEQTFKFLQKIKDIDISNDEYS